MNNTQQRAIDRLRSELPFAYDTDRTGTYELKQFEITEHSGFVGVFAVVGLKNDEGTAAATYCRAIRNIAVGERGAVTLLNAKRKTARVGWHNVLFAARMWG